MSTDLTKKELNIEVAERVCKGEITTADELVSIYQVSYSQALGLLSNPQFVSLIGKMSKAKAILMWHAKAMPKLEIMLDSKDDKIALSAMKIVGQMTESIKGNGLEININLENLVTESERSNNLISKNQVDNIYDLEEYRKVING